MATTLDKTMTVAELFQRWPQAIPLFLELRMVCAGCWMAPFDTIEDVTRNYGLPVEPFIARLEAVIDAPGEAA